jgi:uncharacterized repeat protein (TIGR03803 family)
LFGRNRPLHSFVQTDGASPFAPLVQATDGKLYGTTNLGGTANFGTVFKITTGGTLTSLHSFDETDGYAPAAGLVQATDGKLYGTTGAGGQNANGVLYKITPSGAFTIPYAFCMLSGCADGAGPFAIIQANGSLYGTTGGGGAHNSGTVYKITLSGKLTTLYSFCAQSGCPDGLDAAAGLAQGTDGNFYGITTYGGANGDGTVFKVTPSGTLTTLHSFAQAVDGAFPIGGVVQGSDGKLYGTTYQGGAHGNGTVFKISTKGTLTTLYNFCSLNNCTDGAHPKATLIQATDGNFYGTTVAGTVFKITSGGTLTTLHTFGSSDGATPEAGLVQDTNGKFYGTTAFGGTSNDGVVFSRSVGLRPFVETRTTSGKVGAAVKILGTSLTGASAVRFNGTAASFKVASSSLITTTVPAGATTGFVTVTTPKGMLKSNRKFVVK